MFGNGWRTRSSWVGWLVVIGACVVVAPLIWLGIRAASGAAPFASLQPHAMQMCRACSGTPVDGAKPYRIGRVLVVQPSGIALGQVMADESLAGITAQRKGEIGTLVCVGEPYQVQTGTSCHGEALYRTYREVCLLDYTSGAVLYHTSLKGSEPTISG